MVSKTDSKYMKRTKDIAAMLPYWDKTDAIVAGADAIRLAGETYLPKFEEEDDDAYQRRLKLSKFTNVYRDVLEGLAVKPFEKEVTLKAGDKDDETIPEQINEFIEDVDGSGTNLTKFAAAMFFNGINSAIDWLFVDYPTADVTATVRTVADQKALGIRPFWSHVLGRNVLEVRTINLNGSEVIQYIRIFEPSINGLDHVRIFERQPTGQITWELYVEDDKHEDGFVLEKNGALTIDVIPLVPFYTGRRDGKSFKFFPVMQDAADLQISLYHDESALQFTKTMAAYPMLAGNGVTPMKDAMGKPLPLAIGPGRVLYAPPSGDGKSGSWNYIEPAATSMTFQKESIKDTKNDLRELGRQPLTAQSGQLTVITTAVASGKAKSAVSAWAISLKDALENGLVITAKWFGVKYDPQVDVYTEFDEFTDTNKDLSELGSARKNGDLSQETYWSELKRRKVLSDEFDPDEERKRLLNEVPSDGNNDLTGDDPPV